MERICPTCGYEGVGKRELRGSRGVEQFIWLVLLVPGPFYSVYRRVPAIRRCTHCGGSKMISLRSDKGKIFRFEFEKEMKPKGEEIEGY